MQNAQHKLLTDLDETGFGIKYENQVSAYTPPHWHKALELLLFVKGKVTCKFDNMSFQGTPGALFPLRLIPPPARPRTSTIGTRGEGGLN